MEDTRLLYLNTLPCQINCKMLFNWQLSFFMWEISMWAVLIIHRVVICYSLHFSITGSEIRDESCLWDLLLWDKNSHDKFWNTWVIGIYTQTGSHNPGFLVHFIKFYRQDISEVKWWSLQRNQGWHSKFIYFLHKCGPLTPSTLPCIISSLESHELICWQ